MHWCHIPATVEHHFCVQSALTERTFRWLDFGAHHQTDAIISSPQHIPEFHFHPWDFASKSLSCFLYKNTGPIGLPTNRTMVLRLIFGAPFMYVRYIQTTSYERFFWHFDTRAQLIRAGEFLPQQSVIISINRLYMTENKSTYQYVRSARYIMRQEH